MSRFSHNLHNSYDMRYYISCTISSCVIPIEMTLLLCTVWVYMIHYIAGLVVIRVICYRELADKTGNAN